MPPVVPIRNHGDVATGSLNDDNFFDGRRFFETRINGDFQRYFFATTPATIGRHDQLCLSIVIPIRHGVGAEASENDRVCRTDPGTGQHGDGQFRDHRHVERNAVACFDSQFFHAVGEFRDLPVQILVCQYSLIARFAFPDDCRLVLPPGSQVAIDAVVAGVRRAADEPLCVRHVSFERLVKVFEPVQVLASQIAPESRRIVLRPVPHLFILLFRADVRLSRKLWRRCKLTVFLQNALNGFAHAATPDVRLVNSPSPDSSSLAVLSSLSERW